MIAGDSGTVTVRRRKVAKRWLTCEAQKRQIHYDTKNEQARKERYHTSKWQKTYSGFGDLSAHPNAH